ncbi:nucleotidyltransferase family protein [Candidatus Nitrospira inopinata]|jgi:NDP-sugar pyrophosphorylase family protein|uniref:Putative Nucleotidyl transferase n=1 Tax=Candidatus Nitrospira inopinata TaxID=1715989 RepID=A0A0S4KVC3_9BACT|nr:NDP-sugar synthase [Candidatus Nitrospira inopinata]CUQ68355.1 putative Nucleotidyl transferase [Candidatus Nitrospira inopinata]
MKAMILAAGLGTRLRPLTDGMPKPLLPVGGTPLIVWNLLLLRRHGFRDVVINLHYLGSMIEEALGDGSQFGLRITYSKETTILGTGGGIKRAEPYFNGEPVLVLNGDTLVELDLKEVMAFHFAEKAVATLVLREDSDAARWGLVEVGAEHRIVRITGKGLDDSGPTVPRMFAGIHILDLCLLRDVPRETALSIIDPYVAAIQRGERIVGYDMQGYWSDVGTIERYTQAEQDVRAGLIRLEGRGLVPGR